MKQKEHHRLADIYLHNRWRQRKLSRNCDWTLLGISTRWAGPQDYCWSICFFGFELRIWFKRTWEDKKG